MSGLLMSPAVLPMVPYPIDEILKENVPHSDQCLLQGLLEKELNLKIFSRYIEF